MGQININITPSFSRDLKRLMQKRGIRQKSEAIRVAVHETAGKLENEKKTSDFLDKLMGMGLKGPLNPNPRFKSNDDLWEKG